MRTILLDEERATSVQSPDADRYTEVWNAVSVMSPLANFEHQDLIDQLCAPLRELFRLPGLGYVLPGWNISDRGEDWGENYRCPDIVLLLNTNPAINHGTHLQGGADFIVEIISPNEDPYAKLDFYSQIGTRELLIVHRNPWALELFRHDGQRLIAAGRSDLGSATTVVSQVTGLEYTCQAGTPRPSILIRHPASTREWQA